MTAEALKQQLSNLTIGSKDTGAYRTCVLEILRFLFKLDLTNGRVESGNIIFDNSSEKSFWAFVRWEHAASSLTFQTIDAAILDDSHLNKTTGSLVIMVTRFPPGFELLSRTYAIFKESTPRKTILILSDTDLKAMLDLKTARRDPATYIQTIYRGFRESVR